MTIKYLDSKRISALSTENLGITNSVTVTQSLTNERVGNVANGNPTGQAFKSGSELIGKNVYEITLYQYYTGTLNADGLMTVGWYSETDDSLIEAWAIVDPTTTLTGTEAAITYTGNHVVAADEVFGLKYTNTGGGVIRNSSQNTNVYDSTNSYYSEAGSPITGRDLKFVLKYGDIISKPTNVETNSILIQKDTTRRYWFDEALAPTFEDDFTSYANQTAADAVWVPKTTATDVNVTNDNIDFNVVGTDTTALGFYYDLGLISEDAWVLRFKLNFSTYTDGDYGQLPFAISDNATSDLGTSQANVGMVVNRSTGVLLNVTDNATHMVGNTGSAGSDFSASTDYYCQISRNNLNFNLKIFSDSSYSVLIQEIDRDITTNIPVSLRYFKIANDTASGVGETTGTLDDFQFWNGVSSATPATWECSNFGKSLTNLHAWYDASDVSSITKDSSNRVSQFNDKSGNGRHLSQATSGSQPLWVSEGQNGKDLIDCVGSRFMKTSTWTAISQPYTFFFTALMPLNDSADRMLMDSISNTSLIYKQTTNDRFLMFAGSNAGATMSGYANTWRYVTAIFDGTNLTYRFDGVHKNTEGSTVGTGTSNGLILGARDGSGFSNSKFGEIIMIAGNPTAQEITDTEAYLKAKWGL